MVQKITMLISLLMLIAFAGGLIYTTSPIGCVPATEPASVPGSQGFRIWSGPTLKSFEHESKKVCVPEGWSAVGEKEAGTGWAIFKDGETAVLIQTSAFFEQKLSFVYSAYTVRLLYPKKAPSTQSELYEATVRNAFERVGRLFNDSKEGEPRTHIVLVTADIERSDESVTPIYPDPRESMTIYMQPPTSARGEELLIHAVAHLYNRQRDDLTEYQRHQSPIPPEDFQELEASWSEVAYRTSSEGRRARIDYLYNIHTAVQTNNFSLIKSRPFNVSKEEFDAIESSILVKSNASFLTAQYGHYILGPLIMTAIDGLLQKKEVLTIEEILRRTHSDATPFFDILSEYLSPEEMTSVRAWMFDSETIPHDLIKIGMESYTIRN